MEHIELPGRLLLKSAKFQEKNVSFTAETILNDKIYFL